MHLASELIVVGEVGYTLVGLQLGAAGEDVLDVADAAPPAEKEGGPANHGASQPWMPPHAPTSKTDPPDVPRRHRLRRSLLPAQLNVPAPSFEHADQDLLVEVAPHHDRHGSLTTS